MRKSIRFLKSVGGSCWVRLVWGGEDGFGVAMHRPYPGKENGMERLKKRIKSARANFNVGYEELADATPWAAFTIEYYLSGKRDLSDHTRDRFIREINSALDRIIKSRMLIAMKEA